MPIGKPDHTFSWGSNSPGDILARTILRLVGIAVSATRVLGAAFQPTVQSAAQQSYVEHPNTPLTPAEAAVGLVKGAIPDAEATVEALLSGIDPDRFQAMVEMTGNPPGPIELVTGWRRGWIDEPKLERGLKQGILKNEWIPFIKRLRHVPLSAETYVRGAVEGDIDKAAAFARADEEGMSADDADLLYRIMGNPPGIVQVLHLWNRGEITEAQVDDVIRDSHYKNRYIEMIKMYAKYWPPPRTVTALLRNGSITMEFAKRLFVGNGLTGELADAYVADATRAKVSAHKELSVTQVTGLYRDQIISHEEALSELATLGYAGDDALLLLRMADAQAARTMRNEAITGIKRVFLARRIDENVARADLAQFGVQQQQQDALIQLWTLQRLAPTETLTVGQLNQAYKKEIITLDDYLARVIDLGYTRGDAEILAKIQE